MARKQSKTTKQSSISTVTAQDVATFDRLKNQMQQLYDEFTTLSKKSPDGSVNKFKLTFINEKLAEANDLLGEKFKPSKHFSTFDVDTLPTNSDVVMMLSQYLDALESWRSSRVVKKIDYGWKWNTDDQTAIDSVQPSRYSLGE